MDEEIKVVAQAITDAHARIPGLDPEGRFDDAKTIIAAFDALISHRGGKLLSGVSAKPSPKAAAPVATKSAEPESAAPTEPESAADGENVTRLETKAKRPRKS